MLKRIKLKGEQKKVLFLPPINPIQIKGVAGSGKTTVALYRAKHLLETQSNLFQESKIVIFTFNRTLSNYIDEVKNYINGGYQKDSEELEKRSEDGLNIDVINFHRWAYHFIGLQYGQTVSQWDQSSYMTQAINSIKSTESNILEKRVEFFIEEVSWVKGKLFSTKQEYLEASRVGRGTADRVTQKDKEVIWEVFSKYQSILRNINKIDFDDYAILALHKIDSDPNFTPPFTHVIVDEAQDLNKAQILTISRLVQSDTNSLTIIADAAQRIYKSGFVWSEVGINVRGGRTIEFKKNYRNTVHIAKAALSLLNNEKDKSEFTTVETALSGGEKPILGIFNSQDEQYQFLLSELNKLNSAEQLASTVILHRSWQGVRSIVQFCQINSFQYQQIKSNSKVDYNNDVVKICTMSSIKGLEFNNVIILDLNEEIIPSPNGFADENDEFHISTERRLLYTCMTRARNNLYLISSGKKSRYIDEIDKTLLEIIQSEENNSLPEDDLPF